MLHDEPLVRFADIEHNLFSVSSEVNTKAYHDAFMSMPVPKSVAEAAYTQSGRILQKTAGKDEEYLVAIDARTGALITDNLERRGYSGSTTFVGSELETVRSWNREVITIHNHPRSLPPSYRDVVTASQNEKIAASVVLGHDGSIWYVSAPSRNIAGHLESIYNLTKDSYGDRAEIRALSELIKRARKVGLVWIKLR